MPIDNYTKDFLKGFRSKLETVSAKIDTLIALAGESQQDGKKSVEGEGEPTEETYATVGKMLLSLYVRPSEEHIKEPKNEWYKSFKWWKSFGRAFKDVIELIAFVFAIGYAIVTYFQWKDLRHNFEVDERAWIKVEMTMPQKLDANSSVVIVTRNVGKSPALEMYGGLDVELVDADKSPEFPPGQTRVLRQFWSRMIFPSDSTSAESGRTPNNTNGSVRPLTQQELDRLTSGNAYLVAFGTLTYRDQFGMHWTRFCMAKGYQTGWKDYKYGSCNDFNTVGDGPVRWAGPSG